MPSVIRFVRSQCVFSMFLCLLLSLILGIFQLTVSSRQRREDGLGDAAREFDGRKREASTASEQAARAHLCRLPNTSSARNQIHSGWSSLGPEAARAEENGKDPCHAEGRALLTGHGGERVFYRGAVSPDGRNFFGGTAQHGMLRGTGPGEWQVLFEGVGGFIAINPDNPETVFAAQAGLSLRRSVDSGRTFVEATKGIDDAGLFIAPFAMDAGAPERLWTGGRRLWRTSDNAAQWMRASAEIAGSDQSRVSAIAIAPADSNRVLAGTSEGFIHRNTEAWNSDGDAEWPFSRPRAGFVSSLVFAPNDSAIAYSTYSTYGGKHVFRSLDGGATWTAIDGDGEAGLPDIPVHTLVIDPRDADRLYIGTDLGVFVSFDGGRNWMWEQAGFSDAAVESLVLHQARDEVSLFAFTRGHGVWRAKLTATPPAPQQSCDYALTPTAQSLDATAGAGSVSVRAMGANCNWTAQADASWITITAGTGSGDGKIEFRLDANATNASRGGRIRVGSRDALIFQAGAGAGCAASPITPGRPVTGALSASDCPVARRAFSTTPYYGNRYSFTAGSGDRISIVMNSTAFRPYLYLIGPNGSVVADTGFSSGDNTTGRIPVNGGFFTLPSAGTYTIEATSDSTQQTGGYLLLLNTVPQNCGSYSLVSTSQRFDAAGGEGGVQVAAASGCPWTAGSTADWVRILSGTAGGGSQFVTFAVAANTTNKARNGRIEIAGQTFTVEQAGTGGSCVIKPLEANRTVKSSLNEADCFYSRDTSSSPSDRRFGERYTFRATAGDQIILHAPTFTAGFDPRIDLVDASGVILSQASRRVPQDAGTFNVPADGEYVVEITSAPGFSSVIKTGDYALTLFRLRAGCGYALASSARTYEAGGGTDSIMVTSPAGCAWTAVADADWITVNTPGSAGSGPASFTVAQNTTNRLRNGAVTINGRSFAVQQAGAGGSCLDIPVKPGQIVSGTLSEADCRSRYRGSSGTYFADRYSFTARAGEQVSALVEGNSFPLVTLADASGRILGQSSRVPTAGFLPLPADGEYYLEVTFNSGLSITGPYALSFNLIPAGCSFSVSSTLQRFEAAGGMGSVDVTAPMSCAWTAGAGASEVNWITVTSGASGAGNGKVGFTVAPNTSNAYRRASLNIAGYPVNVEQAGVNGDCQPRPIASGQTVEGRISAGDCPGFADINDRVYPADRYSFTASAGEQAAITALITPPASSTQGLLIQLRGPNGNAIATANRQLPSSGFQTLPATGTYTIEVTALITPSGSGFFPYTLSLTLSPPGCRYVLQPTQQRVESQGGSVSIDLTTGPACTRTARSLDSWITIAGNAGGTGSGKIELNVAANTTNRYRRGSAVIGEQTVVIEQAGTGGSCAITPITSVTLGQTIAGSLTPGDCVSSPFGGGSSSTDIFSFTGAAGDQIAATATPSSSIYVVLRDSRGNALNSSFSEGSIQRTGFFSLPASGTYFIELVSRSSASVNYSLTLDLAPGTCAYTVTPPFQSIGAAGGTGSLDVIAAQACAWRAVSSDSWLSIGTQGNPSGGTGNGKLEFTVSANTQNTGRAATISIGGRQLTIEQAGAGGNCQPEPISIGQTISGVINSADCRAVASPANPDSSNPILRADRYLLDFSAGQQFAIELNGAFGITILDPNRTNERIILRGQTRLPAGSGFLTLPATGKYVIEISSSGFSSSYTLQLRPPAACAISLTPTVQVFEPGGGQGSVSIVTGANCAWTAATAAGWITLTSGASGTGPGKVDFTVAANAGSGRRAETIVVGAETLGITQAGVAGSCAPTPIAAGQRVAGILTRGDCPARFGVSRDQFSGTTRLNAFADFYTFNGRAGETIMLSPNNAPIIVISPDGLSLNPPVSGFQQPQYFPMTLPVAGVYTLEYSGNNVGNYEFTLPSMLGVCGYVVTPPSRAVFEAGGGEFTMSITAGVECAWTASVRAGDTTPNWLAIKSGESGTGNGTPAFVVAPNTGPARSAEVIIADRRFTITQAGPQGSCAPATIAAGQTQRGTLSSDDCGPDRYRFVGRTGDQIAVALAGDFRSMGIDLSGPDGRRVAGSLYDSRLPGSGFITLPASGDYTIEVRRTGGATLNYALTLFITPSGCAYSISEARAEFESRGGSGGFDVAANGSCPWEALTDADWVTISAGASGTGNGRLQFSVAANNSIFARSARIFVAGSLFNIQQAGLGGNCTPMPIEPNRTLAGSFDEADCAVGVDLDRTAYAARYTFNARAGDQLGLRLTGLIGATMELFAPDGRLLATATGPTNISPEIRLVSIPGSGYLSLPSDGQYVIRVLSYTFASYNVGVEYRLSVTLVPASCDYTVTPARQSFEQTGGQGTITLSVSAGCAWTASTEAAWVTLHSTSGSGSGAINFTVAPNTNDSARRANLTIANRTVVIAQAGRNSSCQTRPISYGATVLSEFSFSDCPSRIGTGSAEFFTFSGRQGDQIALFASLSSVFGSFPVDLAVFDPAGRVVASARTTRLPAAEGDFLTLPADGEYTIEAASSDTASTTFPYRMTLQRFGSGCSYAISGVTQSISAAGGAGSAGVLAGRNCAWNASSAASWVTINPGSVSGAGNGRADFTVAPNSTNELRRGALIIAGRTFIVEQAGGSGSCDIRPIASGQTINGSWNSADCRPRYPLLSADGTYADRYSFNAAAGDRVLISLTTDATVGDTFLTLVAPNGAIVQQARGGRLPLNSGFLLLPSTGTYILETAKTISIAANYNLTLNLQSACTYTLTPSSLNIASSGGLGSVAVAAAQGCDWLSQSNSDWLTIAPANSFGSGNASALFTAGANTAFAMRSGTMTIAGKTVNVTQAALAVNASSASFSGGELAPASLVSAFGAGLATRTETAPAPVASLAGTTVKVLDSGGTLRDTLIFFVSPTQVNYLMPAGAALGPATVFITSGDGAVSTGAVMIANVTPSLFSANSTGRDAGAGVALRIKADGTRSFEPIVQFDTEQKRYIALPIDLGPEGEQVFFISFGTGFRNRASLDAVKVKIGGVDAAVNFAGAQGELIGIDQLNVLIPRSLAGKGDVDVILTVENKTGNAVKLNIR